jgi:hypothetical protein
MEYIWVIRNPTRQDAIEHPVVEIDTGGHLYITQQRLVNTWI